ncbi:MAG: (Fe-S)-binding protein, partial [SAR324 cluster bacterium]|nr:(Fe-S)-binding protein [SAR324 cluster bacterium]
ELITPESLSQASWCSDKITVFYDAPCHLMHAQGVDANPRQLIDRLPGVKLVTLPESNWCCGSAGIYNLVQPDLAGAVLERKITSIRQTLEVYPESKILLTANPGCLYQIRAGVSQAGLPLKVMHSAVFLAGRLKD